jgi:hypothetical protein
MSQNLKALDDDLNQHILSGRALEAMEKFYDTHVAMAENNDAPTVGLAANIEREKQFFAMVESYDGKLVSQGVGDGVTFTEWYSKVGLKNGVKYESKQVAVRRWQNGKIVSETFFYKPAA